MLDARKNYSRSTKRPPKNFGPKFNSLPVDDIQSNEHMTRIEAVLSDKLHFVTQERVKTSRELGECEWNDEFRLGRELKKRGKHHYFGRTRDGQHHLYPEECLFLLEAGDYQVKHQNLPLSLQEAYSVLLTNSDDFERYRVFSTLLRQGYHVKKFIKLQQEPEEAMDTTDDEVALDCVQSARKRRNCDQMEVCDEKRTRTMASDDVTPLERVDFNHRLEPLTMKIVRNREDMCIPLNEFITDEVHSWQEYNELMCQKSQKYSGLALKLTDLNVSVIDTKSLPTGRLYTNSVMPLINPVVPTTLNNFLNKLQSSGPREANVYGSSRNTNCALKIDYELFNTHSGIAIDYSKPDAYVVVCSSDYIVNLSDVIKLNRDKRSPSAYLLFAVVNDSISVSFNTLTEFNIWSEFPELWTELDNVD